MFTPSKPYGDGPHFPDPFEEFTTPALPETRAKAFLSPRKAFGRAARRLSAFAEKTFKDEQPIPSSFEKKPRSFTSNTLGIPVPEFPTSPPQSKSDAESSSPSTPSPSTPEKLRKFLDQHHPNTPPRTPPKPSYSGGRVVMPTPRRDRKRQALHQNTGPALKKQKTSFSPDQLPTFPINNNQSFPLQVGQYRATSAYQTSSHQEHLLFRQRSSKDCGSSAALMLLSSFSRMANTTANTDRQFIEWLGGHLYNLETMREGITIALGDNSSHYAHATRIPLENPIEAVQQELKKTGFPVIVAITHPQLEGHWVVVDAITEDSAYLRDPYTGGAYEIPLNVMKGYLQAGEVDESLVSIRTKTYLTES